MLRFLAIGCLWAALLFPGFTSATISLQVQQNFNFGKLVLSDQAGNAIITISPDGQVTNISGLNIVGSAPQNAVIKLTGGEPASSVTMSFASSSSNGISISNITTDQADNICILDGAGECTAKLGATLNINANQAVGDYTSSITVTLNY